MSEHKYAVLAEANGAEVETWMYFIKYNGNEKALDYLQHQLTKIDMIILDDMSTFELDLDNLVSEQTAKEMTKVDVNSYTPHRKFDGKLEYIDLNLKKKDANEDMLDKLHEALSYGSIEEYIDEEDITDDSEDSLESESSSSDQDEPLITKPNEEKENDK